MDEVYTCKCGGQSFSIHSGFIRCVECQKEYKLQSMGNTAPYVLEDPEDFNRKIGKEREPSKLLKMRAEKASHE